MDHRPGKPMYLSKDGKPVLPFSLNASMSSLPELHRAVTLIENSRIDRALPSFEDVDAASTVDEEGIRCRSMIPWSQVHYTNKIYTFGDFAVFVEYTGFKGQDQKWVTYHALAITKRKTGADAGRSTDPPFYAIHIPVDKIRYFLHCIAHTMEDNGICHLPLAAVEAEDPEEILKESQRTQRKTRQWISSANKAGADAASIPVGNSNYVKYVEEEMRKSRSEEGEEVHKSRSKFLKSKSKKSGKEKKKKKPRREISRAIIEEEEGSDESARSEEEDGEDDEKSNKEEEEEEDPASDSGSGSESSSSSRSRSESSASESETEIEEAPTRRRKKGSSGRRRHR